MVAGKYCISFVLATALFAVVEPRPVEPGDFLAFVNVVLPGEPNFRITVREGDTIENQLAKFRARQSFDDESSLDIIRQTLAFKVRVKRFQLAAASLWSVCSDPPLSLSWPVLQNHDPSFARIATEGMLPEGLVFDSTATLAWPREQAAYSILVYKYSSCNFTAALTSFSLQWRDRRVAEWVHVPAGGWRHI